ncbi:MAG: replication and repair protein RecF [Solirubrobacteraceae bacterium]|nr:replication and repair protein RecF [Solirubrobacteraceae bacterium]
MRLVALTIRNFRCYQAAEVAIGDGVTVIWGPNGAGKTNLLEALYFGCTGRSCRTTNEREIVRFGATTTRSVVDVRTTDGKHQIAVGFEPGQPKRMSVDGAPVERLLDVAERPLVSVFMPDRLELVKGPPGVRRAHLDQVVAARWPTRTVARRSYAHALAQRNALLARIRSGRATRDTLSAWDWQLAGYGIELMKDRAEAVSAAVSPFTRYAEDLGLTGSPTIEYRPRSKASTPGELAQELAARVDGDLERGFTGHGPHRDDLHIARVGRDLRSYGSQGQQRLALLALLLAEREVISAARPWPPVMLLDDVMSELDQVRRRALIDVLHAGAGQAVITTTDVEHVPGARSGEVSLVAVSDGRILHEAAAA